MTIIQWLIGDRNKGYVFVVVVGMLLPFSIFALAGNIGPSAGASVPWRPPPVTYGIVWTFLILTLAVAWWVISLSLIDKPNTIDWILLGIGFVFVVGLAILWMILYPLEKRNGISVSIYVRTRRYTCIASGQNRPQLHAQV